tara:strand:+ start:687 stop:902 length:216 start_codon:yes stop_codon:yes gene_type:complete
MKKKARNDFEVMLRTLGITKKRFGEITETKGTTVDKYLANPSLLRVKHIQCLANADEIECDENELLNYLIK